MHTRSANKRRASGAAERNQPQEPFTIKYGPITIHQNGVIAKELAASEVNDKPNTFALEQVRLSMHVERYESAEKLSVEFVCVTRFPEFGVELKHSAHCEMRVGQTHGAAVVIATSIPVNFENGHDTTIEVEYSQGEEALFKTSIPFRFPEGTPEAERSLTMLSTNQL